MNDKKQAKADANPDATASPHPVRKLFRDAFTWIGVAAALLGVIEGSGYVWERWEHWSKQRIAHTPLVTSAKKVEIGKADPIAEPALVADTIEVAGGEHAFRDGTVWIANHVYLRDGAILKGHRIVVIAASLEGGRIDVSGDSPQVPGATGGDGGEILVATGHLANVELLARGGNGANGAAGAAGADGRDGNCAGFGGYRGADGGQPGQSGRPGGNGGNGGRIRLASADVSPAPTPGNYSAGKGGAGGVGGQGGRGGAGCVGLGGSQTGQGPGRAGGEGPPGQNGTVEGKYDPRALGYDKLLKIVHQASEGQIVDPASIEKAVIREVYSSEAEPN
jgi:hypothetical protein